MYFYPYKGAGTKKDPLMEVLNDIVCKGATDGTGTKGHTRIRIAQTSMWGDRGIMIARRLRVMWQRGCDIKIVYAVLGNNVLWVLRHTTRGKVPIRQIAQDFNRDGVYDRYLHMKNMASAASTPARPTSTSPGTARRTGRRWRWPVTRSWGASSTKLMRDYSNWVDFLYAHPPAFSNNPGTAVETRLALKRAIANGIDPYSKMQLD